MYSSPKFGTNPEARFNTGAWSRTSRVVKHLRPAAQAEQSPGGDGNGGDRLQQAGQKFQSWVQGILFRRPSSDPDPSHSQPAGGNKKASEAENRIVAQMPKFLRQPWKEALLSAAFEDYSLPLHLEPAFDDEEAGLVNPRRNRLPGHWRTAECFQETFGVPLPLLSREEAWVLHALLVVAAVNNPKLEHFPLWEMMRQKEEPELAKDARNCHPPCNVYEAHLLWREVRAHGGIPSDALRRRFDDDYHAAAQRQAAKSRTKRPKPRAPRTGFGGTGFGSTPKDSPKAQKSVPAAQLHVNGATTERGETAQLSKVAQDDRRLWFKRRIREMYEGCEEMMDVRVLASALVWDEEIRGGRLRETLRINLPNLLSALMLDNEVKHGQWKPELADRGYIPHKDDVLRALLVSEREQWWQWFSKHSHCSPEFAARLDLATLWERKHMYAVVFLSVNVLEPERVWVEWLEAQGLLNGGKGVRLADNPAAPAEAAEPTAWPSQPAEAEPSSELAAAEPGVPLDAAEQQRLALQQVAAALERAFVQRPAPAVIAGESRAEQAAAPAAEEATKQPLPAHDAAIAEAEEAAVAEAEEATTAEQQSQLLHDQATAVQDPGTDTSGVDATTDRSEADAAESGLHAETGRIGETLQPQPSTSGRSLESEAGAGDVAPSWVTAASRQSRMTLQEWVPAEPEAEEQESPPPSLSAAGLEAPPPAAAEEEFEWKAAGVLPYTFSKKHDNALLVLLGWSDFQMRSKQEPGLTILGGKRKSVDVSPQATAIRELFEETAGLMGEADVPPEELRTVVYNRQGSYCVYLHEVDRGYLSLPARYRQRLRELREQQQGITPGRPRLPREPLPRRDTDPLRLRWVPLRHLELIMTDCRPNEPLPSFLHIICRMTELIPLLKQRQLEAQLARGSTLRQPPMTLAELAMKGGGFYQLPRRHKSVVIGPIGRPDGIGFDPSPVRERWGLTEPKLPPNKTGIISVAPGQVSQARLMEQWNNGIIWSATPAAAAVAAPSGPGAAQPAARYQIEPYPWTAKGSLRVFHVQPNEPLREEIEDNRQQPRDLRRAGRMNPPNLTSALLTASGSFLPSVPRPARTFSREETCRVAASLFPANVAFCLPDWSAEQACESETQQRE